MSVYSHALRFIPAVELACKFCSGEYTEDVEPRSWTDAFRHIAANVDRWQFDNEKMQLIWTVSGGILRNKIRDDALILRVIRAMLPGYTGPGLFLYRGECQFLYDAGKIGFCWSSRLETAKLFAHGPNRPGVVLRAFAPQHAILSTPNEHSSEQMQELEYTCDPTSLRDITVLHTYDENTPESETDSILWDFLAS